MTMEYIISFIKYCISNIGIILYNYWSFLILGISFVLFVIINKGIVVGDRSAHAPVLHFPQFYYFLTFSMFNLILDTNVILYSLSNFKQWIINQFKTPFTIIRFLLINLIIIFTIYQFTYVHPYLVADNRHYTFYIWKNIFSRFYYSRFILLPVYVFSFWLIYSLLRFHFSSIWCSLYLFCCVLLLTPVYLLEFRYFITPFIWIKLHTSSTSKTSLYLQLIVYSLFNFVLLYVFLHKPFSWPNYEDPMRFMW